MINQPQPPTSKLKKQRIVRVLLMVAGTICLTLGAIGVFLPILPATPFLLLAAACYMRSSERLHKWLISNRWFGEYIKNYQEGRGIPVRTKVIALSTLWIAIGYSTFFVVDEFLFAQIALLLIAIGVTVHLVRLPNFKKQL
jgi:uncharacterized membrane protein YbaN (DUF454 family)